MSETIEVEIPGPHAQMLDEMEELTGQDIREDITSGVTPEAILSVIEDTYKQMDAQRRSAEAQQAQAQGGAIAEDVVSE